MNVTGLRGRGRKGAPEGVPVTIVKVGTKRVWGNPENLLYPVMGEKGVCAALALSWIARVRRASRPIVALKCPCAWPIDVSGAGDGR